MFSGKSEELIRRLRRAQFARQELVAFKPRLDNRYSEDNIASHSQQQIPCIQIDEASEIQEHLKPDTQVVGIDEVQFLGPDVVPIVEELAARGLRVICAGLDQDYRGLPWYPMPELLARAEYIEKTLAICVVCGNPANRTQRKVLSGDLVLIGSQDSYEARCRNCHTVPEEEGVQTEMFEETGK
jgi:thymidine kinase